MAKRTTRRKTKTTKQSVPVEEAKPSLDVVTVADLEAEIARRKRGAERLLRKRERLMDQVHGIDQELSELGVAPNGTGMNGTMGTGKRPRNDMTLPEAIVGVLQGNEMSVTEIADAVQQAGYRTSSANFRTIVNQALIREKKMFKKVGRGVYTTK